MIHAKSFISNSKLKYPAPDASFVKILFLTFVICFPVRWSLLLMLLWTVALQKYSQFPIFCHHRCCSGATESENEWRSAPTDVFWVYFVFQLKQSSEWSQVSPIGISLNIPLRLFTRLYLTASVLFPAKIMILQRENDQPDKSLKAAAILCELHTKMFFLIFVDFQWRMEAEQENTKYPKQNQNKLHATSVNLTKAASIIWNNGFIFNKISDETQKYFIISKKFYEYKKYSNKIIVSSNNLQWTQDLSALTFSWSNVMYFFVTSLWMAKNASVVTKPKNLSCAIILIGHLWLQQLVGLSFTCNTSNCTPHLLSQPSLTSLSTNNNHCEGETQYLVIKKMF